MILIRRMLRFSSDALRVHGEEDCVQILARGGDGDLNEGLKFPDT